MNITHIKDLLTPWITFLPTDHAMMSATVNTLSVLGLLTLYVVIRRLVMPKANALIHLVSEQRMRHLTPALSKSSGRLSLVICSLVLSTYYPRLFIVSPLVFEGLATLVQIMVALSIGFFVSSVLNLAHGIYRLMPFAKDVPIQGIIQVLKLLTFIVTVILTISIILDKSPAYILSGFGAIAAVVILVFKDTILGLVASIQIAANRLVKTGDWIQVDTFGADGEVIDLGLNTVRVRNWDNTVTTIPTYMLISDSFKNWRAMQESPGRRIKRSILIDLYSIKKIDTDEALSLAVKYPLLSEVGDIPGVTTNLGLFRRYAELYLKNHKEINQSCTCMVRELAPGQFGLPIEIYCFSSDKRWVPYEHLQSDIMDYLLSTLSEFGLKPYQQLH